MTATDSNATDSNATDSTAIDWLLEGDPSIRWQVMAGLTDEPPEVVAAERARVATEGWGGRLLSLQAPDGSWGGTAWTPEHDDTFDTLYLLRAMGLDPASPEARHAIELVREHVTFKAGYPGDSWDGNAFFAGEVEPCINGRIVAIGAYFGVDVKPLVDRLLGEQLPDGGWNCEVESGSTVSSLGTSISVLEGLIEHERVSGDRVVAAARHRGEDYMLERRLFRRRSTGEVIDPTFLQFSFPTFYLYDVLRGLDYLQSTGEEPDPRTAEAIDVVAGKRDASGRWPRENVHPGRVHFEMEAGEGSPSRWNTLRALRVLRWAGRA
jgi:hypothetical protein